MQATMLKCCDAPVLPFMLIINRVKRFLWSAGAHLTPILVHVLHMLALKQLTSSSLAGGGGSEQWVSALTMHQGLSGVTQLYQLQTHLLCFTFVARTSAPEGKKILFIKD